MNDSMLYSMKNRHSLNLKTYVLFLSFMALPLCQAFAQVERAITTAVPFLSIAPDSRASGMGDAGVATSADANATFWNPAKLAYAEKDFGVSLSYSPWLRQIINDMSLAYLSGYMKLGKEQALALSIYYSNLGEIAFVDAFNQPLQVYNPQEYSISGTYSRKLSDHFSLGASLKFIHSNLSGNYSNNPNVETRPGNTFAGDLGAYYENDLNLGNSKIAFGLNISNFGAKIAYANDNRKDFIPTNLRLGTAVTTEFNELNRLTFTVELNKLMVPTPPRKDPNNQNIILEGKDPNNTSLLSGVFGSFGDAPDGFREELKEIIVNGGLEYWYNNMFAARVGYLSQSDMKGGQKYLTTGLGVRYKSFGLDASYLIPVRKNNPLAETLRFTLVFTTNRKGNQDSVKE